MTRNRRAGRHVALNRVTRVYFLYIEFVITKLEQWNIEDPDLLENFFRLIEGDHCAGIQKLEKYGVPVVEIQKLRRYDYNTIESVAFTPKKALTDIIGISEEYADKILTEARILVPDGVNAELPWRLTDTIKLTTGSETLDKILQGGIETGTVTEIFGDFRSGKLELLHTLAVTCQLPVSLNGGEGKCLYVDFVGKFNQCNLLAAAQRFDLDNPETLDNVVHIQTCYYGSVNGTFTKLVEELKKARFALLIIDDASLIYRGCKPDQDKSCHNRRFLSAFLCRLCRLAEAFGVAVVVTSETVAQMDASLVNDFDRNKKERQNDRFTTTRLHLKQLHDNLRQCKIYASSRIRDGDAVFAVSEDGVHDVEK